MSESIIKLVQKSPAFTPLLRKSGAFVVSDVTGVSLLFAALFDKKPDKYVILTPNLFNAQKVANFLASLIGEENVLLFPTDDLLRCELLTSSKELLAQRIFTMNECLKDQPRIVVTHASSLLTPLPNVFDFKQNTFNLAIGDSINLNELKERLVKSGYTHVSKIDQSLQFASRGDILDIFPVNSLKPFRIEFFGDEIDAIHTFDIATQTSDEEVNEVTILPANDTLMSDKEIEDFKINVSKQLQKDIKSLDSDTAVNLERITNQDVENISQRIFTPRTYKYYRYIKPVTSSILDYFKPSMVFITNEKQFNSTVDFIQKEAKSYFSELNALGKLITHLELYCNVNDVLKNEKCILHGNELRSSFDEVSFESEPLVFNKQNIRNNFELISSYIESNEKVILALSNKQHFDSTIELLNENKVEYEITNGLVLPTSKKVAITIFSLEEGFELTKEKISVLSSKELFGYQNRSSRFLNRYKEATIVKNYDDLKPGDFVVHEYYGIGKFIDVETIEVEGLHRDFLKIKYAGTDSLYVPLSQFRLVRKYAGREGAEPKLSSLSGDGWSKTKEKIKERVNLLADRLFKLYSERAHIEGHAFKEDDELQEQFENEFPHPLTKDQEAALVDIKKDMESPYAMDRLLCGDVGFGKTEVAFRAIFKCINDGKQAAILCPTTLLSRQHYEVALERFRNYGIKVAHVSRLVTDKQQKEYIQGIKDGSIHLVIGTHRLLSKDFEFKDLGLLVVDEEQRFGVEQKELIKEMKNNVDVLSLSATPIPRTLQLSLIGVRPVSQINTAPSNRSTIQTYVAPFNSEIVRELIERELSRKGQVFYVHNVVSSIGSTASMIKRKIPSASIGVVHGKMAKEDIEDTMFRFYSGEINVLVATSIIENGIDIPNANLIIVEDADHFGLSQLYQIKGRVGRGDRIAYAYLFYREEKTLSNVATKRLKAIQDFAELGSGYKIAQRDLMIRGAGDILGPEQAGFIDSIGLDLYLKMMNEVIEERKTGIPYEPPKPVKLLKLDAYIPGEYASKEDKIQLYQEIENCHDLDELNKIKAETRDIYGRLPEEVSLLFRERKLDLVFTSEEFQDLTEQSGSIEIILSKKFSSINGIGNYLFEELEDLLDLVQVTYIQKTLRIKLKKEGNWFKNLETIAALIQNLYKKFKKEENNNV